MTLWLGAFRDKLPFFMDSSYHPVKFGGHRHSRSTEIMIFVCHVTLQDRVISVTYRLRALQDKSPSNQVS